MPKEEYDDRQKHAEKEDRYRRKGEHVEDRRREGSSRSHQSKRRSDDEYERARHGRRRSTERDAVIASSSRRDKEEIESRSAAQRRSRSPDFERDRARERQSYDRRHRENSSRSNGEHEEQQRQQQVEPNFEASGLLAKESNNKNGVALKYAEPPEARKAKKKWRLYVFKDGKEIDVLHISRQSCYLMGRDRAVADIPIDHPSISKQHAVIQFRNIRERNEFGDEKQSVKPFLLDLESANGCLVNDAEVPPSRYYEMRNGDTLKLGGSQREYVLLAEE
ncbi:hypothetical protein CBS101457_002369 [Exobasidium rhododendri]|nr:hypothetical protein CBS101457_002369 [Exobasidium rhododendri]